MTKKSKLVLAMASMLGITAGAAAVSGFAWFTTTKAADVDITNIGVYSKSSALSVVLTEAIKGCTDAHPANGVSLVGQVGAAKTELLKSDGTTTVTLSQYPSVKPTSILVGGEDKTESTTWTTDTKTLTLAAAPASGTDISVTYTPYAALTDVSSADGQSIYKPTWTAEGEGRYASAMPLATEGYVQFSMTLTATGSSDLQIYLNQPSITGLSGSGADLNAANITRVAFFEGTTTDLIIQNNSVATNNLGIDSTFAAAPNCRLDGGAGEDDGWDVHELDTTVTSVIGTKFATPDATNKSILSSAPATTAANNYITTITHGTSKLLTVSIWLEGTSGNGGTADGAFAASPENGMINVSLPLIAF